MYRNYRVKQNGFETYAKYQKCTAEKRQKRKKNRKLSGIIKEKLIELDRNQSWLARRIEMNIGTVSKYANGILFPSKEVLMRISKAIDIPEKTLEELISENIEDD